MKHAKSRSDSIANNLSIDLLLTRVHHRMTPSRDIREKNEQLTRFSGWHPSTFEYSATRRLINQSNIQNQLHATKIFRNEVTP